MKTLISRIINVSVCLAVGIVCFWFGKNIPVSEQLPLFDSLRETASIIFTVMGIWIAVIFPEVLQRLAHPRAGARSEKEKNYNTVRKLIFPMILSTFVIGIVLLLGISVPVLEHVTWAKKYSPELRRISFAMLGVLSYGLFWSLIGTLIPQDIVLSGIKRIEDRKRLIARYFSGSEG